MLRRGVSRQEVVVDVFDLSSAHFDYEPFPTGFVREIFTAPVYAQLCADYPDPELFEFMPELGNKYSLSERNNPGKYRRFVAGTDSWREFHEYVKGRQFVPQLIAFLEEHNIDLGLGPCRVVSKKRLNARTSPLNRIRRIRELSARFEFSMMGAGGGFILPHTDAPNKLITLVVSMMRDGEWNPAWGGGTSIVKPRDTRRTFNRVNNYLEFDDVESVRTYEFKPNQCVVFVKTFNSWHGVPPMSGDDGTFRRTLTINIEEKK
jgi:hypothetical protein